MNKIVIKRLRMMKKNKTSFLSKIRKSTLDKNTNDIKKKVDVVLVDNILSKERRDKMSYCPHMMVAGKSGKGVVFTSKWLLNQAIKNTSDKFVVVDMFGDFKEICNNVPSEDCTIVNISSDICLNPLEIVSDDVDDVFQFQTKFDFLESFFELAMNRKLTSDERWCLDVAYKSIKRKHNKTFDDLYKILEDIGSKDAKILRDVLCPYLELTTYNTPGTNINSKITYVDLSGYSSNYKEVAYMFIMEWVSGQMMKNLKEGSFTFVCLPFMEKLENIPEQFVSNFVKRARIEGGKLFFVTHEIKIFSNRFRGAFQNIATLLLLNQSDSDFEFVKEYLALPKELKNPDAVDNHDGLLIEGSKVSICQFNI